MNYQMKTTFWNDFTIAEQFGDEAIKDTYKRAFNEWKTDYIYLTELVMVLNWKCWEWFDRDNLKRSKLYEKLFYESDNYALKHLKKDELKYFLNTTD